MKARVHCAIVTDLEQGQGLQYHEKTLISDENLRSRDRIRLVEVRDRLAEWGTRNLSRSIQESNCLQSQGGKIRGRAFRHVVTKE